MGRTESVEKHRTAGSVVPEHDVYVVNLDEAAIIIQPTTTNGKMCSAGAGQGEHQGSHLSQPRELTRSQEEPRENRTDGLNPLSVCLTSSVNLRRLS